MRVLAVSTRRRVPEDFIDRLRERAQIPADTRFDLLTVHPVPRARGFGSVHCVQPSLAPWRPVITTAGDGAPLTRGKRLYARALSAGRRLLDRAPVPASARRATRDYLAPACATSGDLHRQAREYDAVVATDAEACLGLWSLGRHVPEVPMVHRATSIRRVLEGLGIDVPKVAPRNVMKSDDVVMPATLGLPRDTEASRRLLIAPANYAGQAHAW